MDICYHSSPFDHQELAGWGPHCQDVARQMLRPRVLQYEHRLWYRLVCLHG